MSRITIVLFILVALTATIDCVTTRDLRATKSSLQARVDGLDQELQDSRVREIPQDIKDLMKEMKANSGNIGKLRDINNRLYEKLRNNGDATFGRILSIDVDKFKTILEDGGCKDKAFISRIANKMADGVLQYKYVPEERHNLDNQPAQYDCDPITNITCLNE